MIKKRFFELPIIPLYYSIPLLFIFLSALLILSALFNIESPQVMLQVPTVPPGAIIINSCGTLDQDGAYYILNQGIVASSTPCINIIEDNIVLDGGFNLIRGLSGSNYGVYISGNNVTVINMNLTGFSTGIYIEGNDSLISSNYINDSSHGISAISVFGINVIRNRVYNSRYSGIGFQYSGNSLISENYIENSNAGIDISFIEPYDSNVTISSNVINISSNQGISLLYANKNKIIDTRVINSLYEGIRLHHSELNELTNVDIINPRQTGLVMYSSSNPLKTTSLKGVRVINGSSLYYDLNVNGILGNTNSPIYVEIADSLFANYSINNSYVNFVSSSNSRINFTDLIYNAKGSNLSRDLRAGFNYVDVNSSKLQWNKSATITFYNLPTNIVNATILRNGVICNSPYCVNRTSLSAGTVVFDVLGWTNYSIWSNVTLILSNNTNSSTNYIPQSISINEPDSNEVYREGVFPVNFDVSLTVNGTVKFSLNNGATNTTMNTTNNIDFTYRQVSLDRGSYTFIAYANFSNGTRINDRVNFSVIANTGSSTGSTSSSGSGSTSSGSTSGGPSPNNTNNNQNNRTYSSTTTSSSGGANGPSSSSSQGDTLRKVVFWLIIGVMVVIIVILIVLVVRALRARVASQNQPVAPRPTSYPQPTRLMSNLR